MGSVPLRYLPILVISYRDGKWPFLRDYESIVALSESEKSALPLLYQMQRIWMKASVANDL